MSEVFQITAIIKARNEQRQIQKAVQSALNLADRVIVIDDRSTDETADLASMAGAEVFPALNHGGLIDLLDRQAMLMVENGWILRMDADERLTPELIEVLRGVASRRDGVAGARYARLNHMFGKGVEFGGWFEPHQLGFFRADRWDRQWTAGMHSQVPVVGEVMTVPPATAWMIHLDYDSVEQFVERSLLRYARAEAREMRSSGAVFRRRDLLIRPTIRLWGRYVVRRGYKDGNRGLVLAALLSAYDICRYSMLWDELDKSSSVERGLDESG